MNDIVIKREERIYEVRGTLVMLDSDLAKLYQFSNGTKAINLVVKRHMDKFNKDVYFQLTNEEYNDLKLQFETSNYNNYGGIRKLPFVFTYEGIEILNSILRKEDKEIIMARIKRLFDLKNNDNRALMPVNTAKIKDLIYEIRGKQVMLDSDLAMLYNCKNGTKTINLAVKRHPNRFPERYCFKLTKAEIFKLRFQIETAKEHLNMNRTLPYVFTEEGVAMLSSVLRTTIADKVSIAIMDAFVAMRKYISNELLEKQSLQDQITQNTEDIKLLKESFNQFQNKDNINTIFFDGQIYDAYSKLVDIMTKAQQELIIIDSYADKTTLDMIAKVNCPVILITKKKNALKALDLAKYQEQYSNLTTIRNDTFHDRYLLLDNKTIPKPCW